MPPYQETLRNKKSWKEGYKASKEGEGLTKCPYELDDESKRILIKRDRWIRGWEEYRYRVKKPMKHKEALVNASSSYGVKYIKSIKSKPAKSKTRK